MARRRERATEATVRGRRTAARREIARRCWGAPTAGPESAHLAPVKVLGGGVAPPPTGCRDLHVARCPHGVHTTTFPWHGHTRHRRGGAGVKRRDLGGGEARGEEGCLANFCPGRMRQWDCRRAGAVAPMLWRRCCECCSHHHHLVHFLCRFRPPVLHTGRAPWRCSHSLSRTCAGRSASVRRRAMSAVVSLLLRGWAYAICCAARSAPHTTSDMTCTRESCYMGMDIVGHGHRHVRVCPLSGACCGVVVSRACEFALGWSFAMLSL